MADAMVTQIWGGKVRYISDILAGGSDWPINRIVSFLGLTAHSWALSNYVDDVKK